MTTGNLVNHQWFRYWQRKPRSSLRLFCFPYAGGGASIFHTWSASLPAEIEVCPVQLPGRENRILEQPFSRIEALIHPLVQALLPYLDMPYAFFGHSMGALLSFELAHYLQRTGQGEPGPAHLFVSAFRAPHLSDPSLPIHHLPESAFIEELRRLEGTPEEVLQNKEFLHLLIPLLRADFTLCETYAYRQDVQLKCPITVFGGLQDVEVSREMLTAWGQHTSQACKQHYFAGSHFFLRAAQQSLLQIIMQDLRPVYRRSSFSH
jgi:medium-chain acyl-[acyl-carrier-protein] hydrolase